MLSSALTGAVQIPSLVGQQPMPVRTLGASLAGAGQHELRANGAARRRGGPRRTATGPCLLARAPVGIGTWSQPEQGQCGLRPVLRAPNNRTWCPV